jgi:hypothetical protein
MRTIEVCGGFGGAHLVLKVGCVVDFLLVSWCSGRCAMTVYVGLM